MPGTVLLTHWTQHVNGLLQQHVANTLAAPVQDLNQVGKQRASTPAAPPPAGWEPTPAGAAGTFSGTVR